MAFGVAAAAAGSMYSTLIGSSCVIFFLIKTNEDFLSKVGLDASDEKTTSHPAQPRKSSPRTTSSTEHSPGSMIAVRVAAVAGSSRIEHEFGINNQRG